MSEIRNDRNVSDFGHSNFKIVKQLRVLISCSVLQIHHGIC